MTLSFVNSARRLAGGALLASALALECRGAATLSGAVDYLPEGAAVDLSAEGTQDWVHWGYLWEQQVDRKYGCPQQIAATAVVGSSYDGPYWVGASINRFAWNDGTPTATVPETHTGILFVRLNHGLQITCPAGTTSKRLKLYLGATQARATLTAVLSGNDAPGYTNTSLLTYGETNAVATLDFQASSSSQTLTVRFTLAEMLGADAAVTVYAATLSGGDPVPAVGFTTPLNRTVYVAPATISLSATSAVASGSITNLELFRNATRIGQTNGPALQTTLSNVGTNTYVFTARATDSRGFAVTSAPVTVYVTTGGGWLQGSAALPATNVDLTAAGSLDWAHWGLTSAGSFNRKAGVTAVLPNVDPLGVQPNKVERFADSRTGFTWTDGTPVASATNTTTGLFVFGEHNGFQFTVPASPTRRQLRLYVGLYGAQGRLEAALSDGSGAPFTSTALQRVYDNGYAVYTLIYASRTASADLVVRWTADRLYDTLYGNVTWQAATLSAVPVLTCAANQTVACDAAWDFVLPESAGFCGAPTLTALSTVTNALCGRSYVATRTWEARDACGNSATCAQTVTVADSTPPVITCPPNQTVEAGTAWTFELPTATDRCDGTAVAVALVGTMTNALCGSAYVATRTWRATDACGNSATCSQSVLVQDSTPPQIACATNEVVDWGGPWDFTAPTASDPGSSLPVGITVFSTTTNWFCASTYTVTRIWQATDACGNYALCDQSVTIVDRVPPELTCLPERTVEDGTPWDFIPPTALDAASGTNVMLTVLGTATNATCGASMVASRTWRVTDACGNATYCTQTVRVQDPRPPTLTLLTPRPQDGFGFRFCTQLGRNYKVLYTGSLSSTNWNVATNLTGTGYEAVILQSQLGSGQRFYRIQVE